VSAKGGINTAKNLAMLMVTFEEYVCQIHESQISKVTMVLQFSIVEG
jgi:hypothetical protein